jgi:tetratricopeptide (TPR) repeat protein
MADNTTTFTTIVDVQVQGEDEVKDLGDNVGEAETKFKSLKSQIRETTVAMQALADEGKDTGAEFQKLRAKLDDLNDAQERVNFQAGQFDDQLASLPGPLGSLGNGIKGFNEGLNKLSTGFKVAFGVVGLIVSAFFALKEALSRTEEGQAKLTKITEAFEKILNGLFAVIEPIAFQLADMAAAFLTNKDVLDVLGKTVGVTAGVFTGLLGTLTSVAKFIWGTLVNNFKTLIEVAAGAGKVIKGVFTFDWESIKAGADQAFTAVKEGVKTQVSNVKELAKGVTKAVVDGYEAGTKGFAEGSKRRTKAENEAYKKQQEEARKRAEEARKQAAADAKKAEEERQKAIEAAQKVQIENYIATLAARDAEIYKAGQKLQEDLLILEKAGFKDRSGALEAHRIATDAINKKYDDEAAKKAEEEKQKKKEEEAKAAEEAAKKAEEKLKAENKARDDSKSLLEADYALKKVNNDATYQDELDLFDRTVQLGKETMIANGESQDAITAYDKANAAKRLEIEKAQQAAKVAIISNALGAVADLVGRETVAGKALSVAQAIINTYQGATLALASSPPPFNFIAAGTVVAAGLMNVKKILETQLPGVPGGGGSGGGSIGPMPTAPQMPTMATPQIQTSGGMNPTSQLADTLAASSGKPIKAYVVSGDVSSQQALDRRTSRAATFSSGG